MYPEQKKIPRTFCIKKIFFQILLLVVANIVKNL